MIKTKFKLKIISLFFFICIMLFACQAKIEKKTNGIWIAQPLDMVRANDTLKILMQNSECGEWGGSKEYFLLFRDSIGDLVANLTIDTVSCDEIISKDGFSLLDDTKRHVVYNKKVKISLEEKKMISRFLQRLLELALIADVHSNAGKYYEVFTTDGILKFSYWNSGDMYDTYYLKVRKKIFGEIKVNSI